MRSERWSTRDEIFEYLEKVRNNHNLQKAGPILFSDGQNNYMQTGESHGLILGLSGAGKTRRFILPMIRSFIANQESFVILDVKGEVYKETACYINDKYNKIVVNFRDLEESSSWNPFHGIYELYHSDGSKDKRLACEMVDNIAHALYQEPVAKDPFWITAARNLFIAIVYILLEVAKPKEINILSVYQTLMNGEQKIGILDYFKGLMEFLPKDSIIPNMLHSYLSTASETRAGIRSVCMEPLSIFIKNEGLRQFICSDTLDLVHLDNEKPLAFYIIVPDETEIYDQLASILVTQISAHFVHLAETKLLSRLEKRLNIVLEELGNCRAIPNLPKLLTASRSRNIRIYIVLQSLSQLDDIYGKSNAVTITSNCDTLIAFRLNDWDTLQELSRKLGERELYDGKNYIKEPLITPAQLGAMETGQCLVKISGRIKYITKFPDYSELFDCCNWKLPVTEILKVKRKPIQTFDIRNYVNSMKKKMLSPSPPIKKGKSTIKEENGSKSKIDIDELKRDMDKRMKEWDALEQEILDSTFKRTFKERKLIEIRICDFPKTAKARLVLLLHDYLNVSLSFLTDSLNKLPFSFEIYEEERVSLFTHLDSIGVTYEEVNNEA